MPPVQEKKTETLKIPVPAHLRGCPSLRGEAPCLPSCGGAWKIDGEYSPCGLLKQKKPFYEVKIEVTEEKC